MRSPSKKKKDKRSKDHTGTLLRMGLDRKRVKRGPGGWERGRISEPLLMHILEHPLKIQPFASFSPAKRVGGERRSRFIDRLIFL